MHSKYYYLPSFPRKLGKLSLFTHFFIKEETFDITINFFAIWTVEKSRTYRELVVERLFRLKTIPRPFQGVELIPFRISRSVEDLSRNK